MADKSLWNTHPDSKPNCDASSCAPHTKWSIAIIGAGPAGYYAAEALLKRADAALSAHICIDIIDRLPTPFGLIRAGVAPDHQSIKQVARRYEQTNMRNRIRFVGNLSLGPDISLSELNALYDAVIIATGAGVDRDLDLPGRKLPGILGSAAFVGWYNSHPDFKALAPNLHVDSVTIIGNGNVALDVARVLAKTAEEMASSDLAPHAADPIHKSALKDIHIIGRRGPLEASFTPKELSEMAELAGAVPLLDPLDLPVLSETDRQALDTRRSKNFALFQKFAQNTPVATKIRMHFRFFRQPVAFGGDTRLETLTLEKTNLQNGKAIGSGHYETLTASLNINCIGYKSSPLEDIPYDTHCGHFLNENGRIREGLYATGWARRGPTGTIGSNKNDAQEVAVQVIDDLSNRSSSSDVPKAGRQGLDDLITLRDLQIVTFRDWKKIEAAEEAAAIGGAPRLKFTDTKAMLSVTKVHKSPKP